MSLIKSLMQQGAKPSGFLGTFIGKMMNRNHSGYYRRAIERAAPAPDARALDIGCGGGQAVRMLAERLPQGKVCGIDHSPEMAALAGSTNRDFIAGGRVEIRQASVSALPYPAESFDLVTAIETIQFWPDLPAGLQEVRRVLKPGGRLVIVNAYPDLEGKDRAYKAVLQIHSDKAYEALLRESGFAEIEMDPRSRPGTILVTARNPGGD